MRPKLFFISRLHRVVPSRLKSWMANLSWKLIDSIPGISVIIKRKKNEYKNVGNAFPSYILLPFVTTNIIWVTQPDVQKQTEKIGGVYTTGLKSKRSFGCASQSLSCHSYRVFVIYCISDRNIGGLVSARAYVLNPTRLHRSNNLAVLQKATDK